MLRRGGTIAYLRLLANAYRAFGGVLFFVIGWLKAEFRLVGRFESAQKSHPCDPQNDVQETLHPSSLCHALGH